MSDERLEELIGAWMRASVAQEPDARESASAILERLDDEGPGARWLPWRGSTFAPHLRAAAAVTLVALAGALLWLTLGPGEPAPDRLQNVLVGASQSPGPTSDAADPADPADPAGPPIHWQSDEVDLYAEGMTLRIGDEVYTGQGASFRVEGDRDGGVRLSVAWEEGGQEHDLKLDFGTDGEDWWVGSVKHERPDVYGPDGARYSGVTWLEGDDDRLPLGEAATGELRVSGTTRMPTCQPLVSHELDVTLELSGLDLTVRPQDRSPLEDLADRLLGPRSPVGRALDPPPAPQAPYLELECPAPDPVALEFGGWDLLAQPAGTGAWRVVGDGIHDLDESIVDVAVGADGAVVVATIDRLLWLGSDAQPVSTTSHVPWPNRVDVAPSGDLLIRGGERRYRKDVLVALDGDRLTRLPAYRRADSDSRASGSEDVYDPSWDAEGTLWVGVSGGVGALVDGAWEYRSRYEYSPLAASTAVVSYGATRSLAAAPDGDVWIGSGPTFAQLRDGRWIEHDPLRPVVESLDGSDGGRLVATPLDLKIDASGTMWGLTKLAAGGRMADATVLVRRIGDEWSVYPFDSVAPGEGVVSQHIAVHDGAVLVLVGRSSLEPGAEPSEARLLRFDGLTTTELARLPAGLGYRIADVGPEGTVWIVGGSAERHHADRLHIVPPRAQPVAE